MIADLSANHVERFALLCGFSVERVRMDYGIDLIVHTYNRAGEIENGRILFQLKATGRLKVSADRRAVSCRLDRADLTYWLQEPMPVILVLYDARAEVAYWLYVQAYFDGQRNFDLGQTGEQVTVALPHANVLNQAAMRGIARYKKAILSQLGGRIHHANE